MAALEEATFGGLLRRFRREAERDHLSERGIGYLERAGSHWGLNADEHHQTKRRRRTTDSSGSRCWG